MNDNGNQPTIQLSRRILQKHLQKLHINDGDILMLKAGTPSAKQEVITGIVDALGRLGKKGKCLVIVVDRFDDLKVLNEKEMNKHGWFRVPQLSRLIHIKSDTEQEEKTDGGEDSKDGR